jgi:hypothetical protein
LAQLKNSFSGVPFHVVSYSNDVASVSKARFVTAWAISMKLGVRIPLIFAILPILLPPGSHLENQTVAI